MTMNLRRIRQILKETDYVRTGGSAEELRTAEYLAALCRELGAKTSLESFPVQMGELRSASLSADGADVPCTGYLCCGSGTAEGRFVYLPNTDAASVGSVKDAVVLIEGGMQHFLFQDLYENGARGFITYNGDVNKPDRDIDRKELRSYVSLGKKLPGVNIHAKDAFALVKNGTKTVRLSVEQREYEGASRNVIAEVPGTGEEWIVLTAHYDSTPLSRGAYDNMSGCIGLLEILEALAPGAPYRYGLRFVFCGSEERGLLGSKAYTEAHADELDRIALNINLDMIGSYMGRFIACVSAEEALVSYIRYFAAQRGWGIAARQGVYSSDSTPFADKGVPAVSFARIAASGQAVIHERYDTMALLSEKQLRDDGAFLADFVRSMADAAVCPVKRVIPDKVRDELDVYLNRKRKEE